MQKRNYIKYQKEEEAKIKKKILDKVEGGEFSLGISESMQIIGSIISREAEQGLDMIEKMVTEYIKKLCMEETGILCFDSALVFPCTSSSILCIEDVFEIEKPLIAAVADSVGLQSANYSMIRDLVYSQEAAAIISSVQQEGTEPGIAFLHKVIFSGARIRHVLTSEEYQDILAVWDMMMCWQMLYKEELEMVEAFSRELLEQRDYVVKVNGEVNTRMYALMDYIQHILMLKKTEADRYEGKNIISFEEIVRAGAHYSF